MARIRATQRIIPSDIVSLPVLVTRVKTGPCRETRHRKALSTIFLRACRVLPADPVLVHMGCAIAAARADCLRVAHVSEELFATLYAQLRQIAQSALRRAGPQLTVSPTTLLHEAYLKISAQDAVQFP